MFGKWSIDADGNIIVKKITTQELEVGSQATPSGIAIYDRATKEPVCVYSENGVLKSSVGACGAGNGAATTPQPAAVSQPILDTSIVATTTIPTSTPDTSSSTTPVIDTTTPTTPTIPDAILPAATTTPYL